MLYAILLLALGITLAMMEVLLPSGGVLGFFAAAAIVAALVLAFRESNALGITCIVVTVVLVPTVVVVGFKVFPQTAVGRRLILKPAVEAKHQRGSAGVSDEDYSFLLEKKGIAVTPLRPSGIAEIDDQRYSVVTEGDTIEDSAEIIVVKIEGNSIVVEPLA